MIYGYARVSTDSQSVAAQVSQLKAAGCDKVFREVASGARSDRNQLHGKRLRSGIAKPTTAKFMPCKSKNFSRNGPSAEDVGANGCRSRRPSD
jgi:predicted site-specific integrase-resolvase